MGRARTIAYNYCKYSSLVRIELVRALVILESIERAFNVLGHELSLSLRVLLTALVVALFLSKLTQNLSFYIQIKIKQ